MGAELQTCHVVASAFGGSKLSKRRSGVVTGRRGGVVAAGLIGAVVPFTLIVIMPTNHKLLPGRDLSSAETRMLLERWGNLRGVRTTLSIVASVLYIWLILGA